MTPTGSMTNGGHGVNDFCYQHPELLLRPSRGFSVHCLHHRIRPEFEHPEAHQSVNPPSRCLVQPNPAPSWPPRLSVSKRPSIRPSPKGRTFRSVITRGVPRWSSEKCSTVDGVSASNWLRSTSERQAGDRPVDALAGGATVIATFDTDGRNPTSRHQHG